MFRNKNSMLEICNKVYARIVILCAFLAIPSIYSQNNNYLELSDNCLTQFDSYLINRSDYTAFKIAIVQETIDITSIDSSILIPTYFDDTNSIISEIFDFNETRQNALKIKRLSIVNLKNNIYWKVKQ